MPTADGAGILRLDIIGVRGVVMRPAAIPGLRAAVEGQAGAEARLQDAARQFHMRQQDIVVALHTAAVASTAAAIIVDACASSDRSD